MTPSRYYIQKEVVFGEKYVEHVYPQYLENLCGLWKKTGHSVTPGEATWHYLCSQCKKDWRSRTHLRHPFSGIEERSYQVRNVTFAQDKWQWDFHLCKNSEGCWGEKTRLWEVRRHYKQWMMTWKTQVGTGYRKTDQLFCFTHPNQSPNVSRTYEDGVARNNGQTNVFLHNNEYQDVMKYFYISTESRRLVPQEFLNMKIVERPPYFQAPVYTCPISMEIVVFLTSKFYEEEMNWELLNRRCQPVEHVYVSLYPGGAGMRVMQFKYVEEKNCGKYFRKCGWIPQWFPDGQYSGHIPGEQSGWQGETSKLIYDRLKTSFFANTLVKIWTATICA